LPAGTPLRLTVTMPELSLVVAVPRVAFDTSALHMVAPGPVPTVTFGGAVIVGGVRSIRTMTTFGVSWLPALSSAKNLTVVTPSAVIMNDVVAPGTVVIGMNWAPLAL
jgi:hypothetical protein